MASNWKRVGHILSVTGIVFVALRLYKYSGDIDFGRMGVSGWCVIAGLSLLYGLLNSLLALAWRNILIRFGAPVTRIWAFRTYGISHIARYIPGNVFHIAGRQSIGMSDGIGAMSLLKASIWDIGLIAVTGGLFAVLAVPALIPAVSQNTAVIIFSVLCFVVGLFLFRLAPQFARAFGWYLLFLTVTGLIFICLIHLTSDIAAPWPFLCGSYVLAWLAGLLTPGAPAGAGVREIVLLFLLKGIATEADLLLAVLLGRVVTVGGDVLFYIASLIIRKI